MKYSQKDFLAAVKKVSQILGGKVTLPDSDPTELLDKSDVSREVAEISRKMLIKQLDDYESAIDDVMIAIKKYSNVMDKWKFDLDENKPEDKKKIAQSRVIMKDAMGELDKQCKAVIKGLNDLGKPLAGELD